MNESTQRSPVPSPGTFRAHDADAFAAPVARDDNPMASWTTWAMDHLNRQAGPPATATAADDLPVNAVAAAPQDNRADAGLEAPQRWA